MGYFSSLLGLILMKNHFGECIFNELSYTKALFYEYYSICNYFIYWATGCMRGGHRNQ
jgi:hypothetical protein